MHPAARILMASACGARLARLRVALSEDLELSEASSAVRVLERSRVSAPDLLVLDLALPGDASELLRVLEACRRDEESLPVLVLAESREAAVQALRTGAADALVEPFEPDELLARVQTLLRLKQAHDRFHQRVVELERLSLTDGLTGLGNRRLFDTRLHAECLRSQRYGDPVSLLLIDLDHFKKVNDRYGHVAGDGVLKAVADVLTAGVRGIDVVCRYGGEEFAVILPRTPHAGAVSVGRRLCESMREAHATLRGEPLSVTGSVGAATFPGEELQGVEDLVRAADSALYRAKRAGRNCLCSWPADHFLSATVAPHARA